MLYYCYTSNDVPKRGLLYFRISVLQRTYRVPELNPSFPSRCRHGQCYTREFYFTVEWQISYIYTHHDENNIIAAKKNP